MKRKNLAEKSVALFRKPRYWSFSRLNCCGADP